MTFYSLFTVNVNTRKEGISQRVKYILQYDFPYIDFKLPYRFTKIYH